MDLPFHYLMSDEPELPTGYYNQLKRSLIGALRFAERRQAKKLGAGKDRVAVTLTIEEAMGIAQHQGFRCALTRLLFYSIGNHSFGPSRPSFDRITHGGPYSVGNVRIVMLGVNGLRGAGTDGDMYAIARALVANGPAVF